MHQGEVIEEGNHESLMANHGTYYSLVEQQNLRRAEEEEQLAFERRESAALLAEQDGEIRLSVPRERNSTVSSLTPSVTAALYGKGRSSTTAEDTEENNKEEKKKVTRKY